MLLLVDKLKTIPLFLDRGITLCLRSLSLPDFMKKHLTNKR